MEACVIVTTVLIFVGILFLIIRKSPESFYNDLDSSAWGLNNGPIPGDTGYGFFGKWAKELPTVPWKNWMWGRRPDFFWTPFTPAPQIDYNSAPDSISNPTTNYQVTLLPVGNKLAFALNGVPAQTLQLDKGRDYFFHVYTPGTRFAFTDGERNLNNPVDADTIWVKFDDRVPRRLWYYSPDNPGMSGLIYLNPIQGFNSLALNAITTVA